MQHTRIVLMVSQLVSITISKYSLNTNALIDHIGKLCLSACFEGLELSRPTSNDAQTNVPVAAVILTTAVVGSSKETSSSLYADDLLWRLVSFLLLYVEKCSPAVPDPQFDDVLMGKCWLLLIALINKVIAFTRCLCIIFSLF
jgi:hypothetical protein